MGTVALPRFLDLELTVGPASSPGHYPVTARGPSGDAHATMALDPDAPDLRTALAALEGDATDETLFLDLGCRLFNALFAGPIEDAYRAALGYAKGQGGKLRLRLRLGQAPEIAALPWEYLYDPRRDLFLAIATDTPLSRHLDVEQLFPGPPPAEPPLRVLLILSNPVDLEEYGLPPLSPERERRVVEEGLAPLRREGQVELRVLTQARRVAISEAMRTFRPHVFHLVGHGAFRRGQGVLLL
ncbi:MAG: CHAT domain-containing protein, partial [Chloroflexi bacterium]